MMNYYVQYFEDRQSEGLIEALGDRSVVILDGRNSLATMKEDARKFNGVRRPKYDGFQIRKGSFLSSIALTPIIKFKEEGSL